MLSRYKTRIHDSDPIVFSVDIYDTNGSMITQKYTSSWGNRYVHAHCLTILAYHGKESMPRLLLKIATQSMGGYIEGRVLANWIVTTMEYFDDTLAKDRKIITPAHVECALRIFRAT